MAGGENTHRIIASFISDENGFPLTGLKKSENKIVDMELKEFEQMCAIIPQLWEQGQLSLERLTGLSNLSKNNEINHLTIGFKDENKTQPYLEMMITRLDELFLSSIYHAKK
jgi:hypothetical protein